MIFIKNEQIESTWNEMVGGFDNKRYVTVGVNVCNPHA